MSSAEECRQAKDVRPSPKLARALFGSKKKKNVDKFYQQQCNLLESFENDSKQIQNFQNKKILQPQAAGGGGVAGSDQASGGTIRDDDDAGGSADGGTDSRLSTTIVALKVAGLNADNGGVCDATNDERNNSPAACLIADELEEDESASTADANDMDEKTPALKNGATRRQSRLCVRLMPESENKNEKGAPVSRTRMPISTRHLAFITLVLNFMLTIAKAVASYLSGSLAIISSLVDSLVDITSGLVIWLTSRAIRKHDPYLYPAGRTRLEPIALVIVSVIMGVASVQIIVQSFESVLNHKIDPKVDLPTICIMIATIALKFVLYICCCGNRDHSVQVLAQDHRNDCISNSVALLCAFCAHKFWIYLDPIGAIVVAVYIAVTWYRTGRDQLMMLSGRSAAPEFINRIIKVCIDHDERINYIDTVYVYHFGIRFLVEVHIVLDEHMRLREAHDISEALQNNIESLPEVERAFVHVDYEFEHKPRDEHKIP